MAQFSHKSPALVKQLEGKLHVVIRPHDSIHAQIYFEERIEGGPAQIVPIPSGYQLIHTDTKEPSGKVKGRYFPISYDSSYHLIRNGDNIVLKITSLQLIE
ncbi:g12935 [Coccomyxa viridis]|uniref:G12935 protein n=1 Tax=Coccomyxa viridis TaxID=1274662 RepID=A0ABP1GBJ0_9CHLO